MERRLKNTIIRLVNIKREGSRIACNIIPEDSKEQGFLEVDLLDSKIIDCELPPKYEWCTGHVTHAEIKLLEMATLDDLPNERLIMWY